MKSFDNNSIKFLLGSNLINRENASSFPALFASHPEKYNSSIQMIREVNAQREEDTPYKICAYYDQHEIIRGFSISESLGHGHMGLYCAVSSKGFPGITEWVITFHQLYLDKVDCLYLGGSETSGVDTSIKKLFPIMPSYFLQAVQIAGDEGYSPGTRVTSTDEDSTYLDALIFR